MMAPEPRAPDASLPPAPCGPQAFAETHGGRSRHAASCHWRVGGRSNAAPKVGAKGAATMTAIECYCALRLQVRVPQAPAAAHHVQGDAIPDPDPSPLCQVRRTPLLPPAMAASTLPRQQARDGCSGQCQPCCLMGRTTAERAQHALQPSKQTPTASGSMQPEQTSSR